MSRIAVIVACLGAVLLSSPWALAASESVSSPTDIYFSAPEQQWLDAHRNGLKVGLTVLPPYLSRSQAGQAVEGISIDYLHLIEALLDLSFEFIIYPSYAELMAAASQGEIDIVFAVTETEGRSDYLLFTPVYSHLANQIFTREGAYTSATMADFTGKRFAVPAGTALVEYIQRQYPDIVLVQTRDLQQAFSQLSAGQVDGVGAYASAGFVLATSQGISNLSIVGDVGFDYHIGFGSQRNEPLLNQLLNKALEAIPPAQKTQIEQRWVHPEDNQRVHVDILKDVVLSLIVVALLMGLSALVFWNRLLKREVATRKRVEARVRFLAYNDNLTGVRNRQYFKEVLYRQAVTENAVGSSFSIILLGLDNFKSINDTLGHKVGDFMLKRVADRLTERISSDFTLARISGDEFAILLGGETNRVMVAHLAEILIGAVNMPMSFGDQSLSVATSVGIACQDRPTARPEAVLECADLALHRAKQINAGGYMFHAAEMSRALLERRKLVVDLRRALKRKQLFLEFQPQVSMHSGKVCGFEALVRWDHPEQGRIPPDKFVPLAEQEGMIITLGDQVMVMACAQAVQWLQQGIEFERIAVNVSVKQFVEPEFVSKVLNVLAQTGLPATKLELEITESLFMRDQLSAGQVMQALTAQGVQFAIDDFGTGFSSLLYLKHLPVDKIKLDQGFIRDITHDHSCLQIVKASLNMGHALHMTVIAEGVESEAEQALLESLYCDQAQGYYYSRPCPAEQITTELLADIESKITPYTGARLVSLKRHRHFT